MDSIKRIIDIMGSEEGAMKFIAALDDILRILDPCAHGISVRNVLATLRDESRRFNEQKERENLTKSLSTALKGSFKVLPDGDVYVCTGEPHGVVVRIVRRGENP